MQAYLGNIHSELFQILMKTFSVMFLKQFKDIVSRYSNLIADKICLLLSEFHLRYTNQGLQTHELYDYTYDPGELNNVYNHPDYHEIQIELFEKLINYFLRKRSNQNSYVINDREDRSNSLTTLIHKKGFYYSELK